MSVFDLPARLSHKADPRLIASDDEHFAEIAATLERTIAELTQRLDDERLAPVRAGQAALERDLEVHRLSARLRALRRFGVDLCLGHIVADADRAPVYIGRFGLTSPDGRPLVLDWRSPAAEPFFAATHANPLGLVRRRRYRWTRGRITDYWDEVFTADGLVSEAALDDQSAFIASLGGSRSSSMRDVLGTIQADQDAIIRASSRGALVADGGPGTGKTVVALHRAAYLLYSDPRLGHNRGGLLFVGPHRPYLAYVADVLPRLGEEGVQTCTVRDLVAEGAAAIEERDASVAEIKASLDIAALVAAAVAHYEKPPTRGMTIETPWADVDVDAGDWREAFDAEPGLTHNEARDEVWARLIEILVDRIASDDGDVPGERVRRALLRSEELREAYARAWPLLDPAGVVADLFSVPAYLRQCAPALANDDVALLQRADPRAWTVSDLPILDAMRQRVGDPEEVRRERRREAMIEAERQQMAEVVDRLIESDDSEMMLMSILRGKDAHNSLVDEAVLPVADPDVLAGPFAHIVVDEAQELSDAEWRMLIARCPSRSFTIVGDRAQARDGFLESWEARLRRIGVASVTIASLTINYRTPQEVMVEAEPVIRSVLPDANVPTSIRSSGIPVRHGAVEQLGSIVSSWLDLHDEGVVCVVGDGGYDDPRVRSLAPELTKGLEFDLVVLIDPESFGDGVRGAVDRYVAMTRATQELVILS